MRENNRDNPSSQIRSKLEELAVRPSKKRGQNFLVNATIAENIISAAHFPIVSKVIEIGPGLGALTHKLAAKYRDFSIVEIEEQFCNNLQRVLPSSVTIIQSDILKLDLKSVGTDLHIISNLPYSISTEVLLKLVFEREVVQKAVVLLQREFAERFAAKPGSKQYGSLSVLGQLVFKAELGAIYQGGSFYPTTEVESRVLLLEKKAVIPSPEEIANIEKILRATFGQRRKQIVGSLMHGLKLKRDVVMQSLLTIGLRGAERPEDLEVEKFSLIAKSFAGVISK